VLPWLEADRREERFRHVLWLETCHALLHLKPLVDANLPSPPVLVFPSWEKTLEQQDATTREGIDKLVVSLLSRFLKVSFSTVDECVRYAQKCPDEFLGVIDQNALFVPPEGAVGTPLKAAIKAYKTSIQTWRSPEFVAMVQGWNDAELVLNGVIERLVPQYHLLDNADNLSAQPMLCLAAHEHYYTV